MPWARAAGAAALAASLALPATGRAATVERVSVGPGGVQADNDSVDPAITPDGRFVAFYSYATNLVAGDTNGWVDVFIRDRQAGVTERVSVGEGDVQGNRDSFGPELSADGRFVLFSSAADNLVPGDTNGVTDLFVRDRRAQRTERVNVATGGAQANAAAEAQISISPGGRYVAFYSYATNLVPGDTNNTSDVFVRDLATGRTELVSVGAGGAAANGFSGNPTISAAGRFVAFISDAQNLGPGTTGGSDAIYVRDRVAGRTTRVATGLFGGPPQISTDGRILAFSDVLVHDRRTGITDQVNLTPTGGQANGFGYTDTLAPGGRYVGFISLATNLVPGDTNGQADAFVRDLATRRTIRVSVAADGRQLRTRTDGLAISAGARFVAFQTRAPSLVPGDTNRRTDLFVRAR